LDDIYDLVGTKPWLAYISHEIVTRHGGRMWFESQEGKGSTFYFSPKFPRHFTFGQLCNKCKM